MFTPCGQRQYVETSVTSKEQSLWGPFSGSAVSDCIILNQVLIFCCSASSFFSSSSKASFPWQAKGHFSWKPSGSPTHWIEWSYSVLPSTVHWVTAYTPCFVTAHLNSQICKWTNPDVRGFTAPSNHPFWCPTSVRKLLGYERNLCGNIFLPSFSADTLPFKIYFVLKYLWA